MNYKKLSEVSFVTVVNLVNKVFEDYIVPINWTISSFERDIIENTISLDSSFLVYENDAPIGFSIVSIRKNRGRIDSIGLLKEYRGKGVSSEILSRTIETLKWKGVESIKLEVEENEKVAVKFYEKHGFKVKRKLESLKYSNSYPNKPIYEYTKEANHWVHEMAISALNNVHRKPNWQREAKTLEMSGDKYNIDKISSKGFNIGYLVWGSNQDNTYIVDVSPSVDSTKYKDIFSDSVTKLLQIKDTIIIVSVPQDDPLNKVAKDYGFDIFLTQIEMEKKIH